MGSNRKRPFGYRMELGEIVLHPAEAETVRWIYDSYLAGASYNALVDKLRERGVPYDGDKPWNKNMAARILADRRYTGEAGFPQIIPEGQFRMVQVRRQERTAPCKKTPAQKELRKLCGGSPPAWVELQVLGLLNRLIRYPELIICPVSEAEPPPEVRKLRRELDGLLHRPPVDETQARELAFRLAALQLAAIGPEEYETLRLRRLFQGRTPIEELEQELLHESVRRITVSNGTVTVLLKNNQTLEGGNVHERYRAPSDCDPSQSGDAPGTGEEAPPAGGRLLPGVHRQRGAALQL